MWGKGSFVWANNGKVFEGFWEDGLPKGKGTFKWHDGSFYEGNFSKDGKDQNGTYHPCESSEGEGHSEWDPQQLYNELNGYSVCPGEKVQVMPSHKRLAIWRSTKTGESAKNRRMSVDGRVSVGLERPSDRLQIWDGGESDARTPTMGSDLDEDLMALRVDDGSESLTQLQPLKAPKKSKRQGETICKGHKNYELMLNLQLGIRLGSLIAFFCAYNFIIFHIP